MKNRDRLYLKLYFVFPLNDLKKMKETKERA